MVRGHSPTAETKDLKSFQCEFESHCPYHLFLLRCVFQCTFYHIFGSMNNKLKEMVMMTYDKIVADVEKLMRKACEEAAADYDEFVMKLNDVFDARFEIVEM